MRIIIANTIMVASMLGLAILAALAVRLENRATERHEQAHTWVAPVEIPKAAYITDGAKWSTPQEILSAAAKAEKHRQPKQQ